MHPERVEFKNYVIASSGITKEVMGQEKGQRMMDWCIILKFLSKLGGNEEVGLIL